MIEAAVNKSLMRSARRAYRLHILYLLISLTSVVIGLGLVMLFTAMYVVPQMGRRSTLTHCSVYDIRVRRLTDEDLVRTEVDSSMTSQAPPLGTSSPSVTKVLDTSLESGLVLSKFDNYQAAEMSPSLLMPSSSSLISLPMSLSNLSSDVLSSTRRPSRQSVATQVQSISNDDRLINPRQIPASTSSWNGWLTTLTQSDHSDSWSQKSKELKLISGGESINSNKALIDDAYETELDISFENRLEIIQRKASVTTGSTLGNNLKSNLNIGFENQTDMKLSNRDTRYSLSSVSFNTLLHKSKNQNDLQNSLSLEQNTEDFDDISDVDITSSKTDPGRLCIEISVMYNIPGGPRQRGLLFHPTDHSLQSVNHPSSIGYIQSKCFCHSCSVEVQADIYEAEDLSLTDRWLSTVASVRVGGQVLRRGETIRCAQPVSDHRSKKRNSGQNSTLSIEEPMDVAILLNAMIWPTLLFIAGFVSMFFACIQLAQDRIMNDDRQNELGALYAVALPRSIDV